MKYKIDLHTHSILSYDGGISKQEYIDAINANTLDYIAITDHNKIAFAQELAKEFPKNIIIGEEIMTNDGEIIGLFIKDLIPKHLSVSKTIELIREQNGIVYIPHPFDLMRAGLGLDLLKKYLKQIDIIETFNARTKFSTFDKKAKEFALKNNLIASSSTDAHIYLTLGRAYNIVDGEGEASEKSASKEIFLSNENLLVGLKNGNRKEEYAASIREKFAPTINVFLNLFRKR
jgi:hypothetical protein